jgi:hypothetical protein
MTAQLYTSSRLRVIRECLRKHHYRYELGLQTEATAVMRFGTAGHAALEAWYRAWMAPVVPFTGGGILTDTEAPITAQDRYDHLVNRLSAAFAVVDASDLDPFDRIKLRVLIVAYHERWGGKDWEVLAVEVEFRYYLGDREIGGKIDAIIRDRTDGRIYVVEHKTTGADASLGSPYWERLTIDTQVSVYIDGAAMLGHDVAGCIYDVLKRPAHEPKLATPIENREYTKGKGCKRCGGSAKPGAVEKGRGSYDVVFGSEVKIVPCDECAGTGWKKNAAGVPEAPRLHANQRDTDEPIDEFEARVVEAIAESPDAFLLRGVVVRLDSELPALRQDLLDAIAVSDTGLTPRNPDACARGNTMCGYFEICAGRASANDFTRGSAHPELESAK